MEPSAVVDTVNRYQDPEEIALMRLEILNGTGPEVSFEKRMVSYQVELETELYYCSMHQQTERRLLKSISQRVHEISERIEAHAVEIGYELSLVVADYQDEFEQIACREKSYCARVEMLTKARDDHDILYLGDLYDLIASRKLEFIAMEDWAKRGAFSEALELNIVEFGYPELKVITQVQRQSKAHQLWILHQSVNRQCGDWL